MGFVRYIVRQEQKCHIAIDPDSVVVRVLSTLGKCQAPFQRNVLGNIHNAA